MSAVGIGGVFFRADDPKALQEWYRKHLGISTDYASPGCNNPARPCSCPFARDTDYFPAGKQWMINFRVAELDPLLAALRDAGIAVITNPEWDTPETGRFARIHDPEGNPVKLWEPPKE